VTLHMIRLCVGCDTIDDLVAWHENSPDPWPLHTRMAPKRADELLDGGSLYRIFRGLILCRQRILSIARVEAGGESHCRIDLEPRILRVATRPAERGFRTTLPVACGRRVPGRADRGPRLSMSRVHPSTGDPTLRVDGARGG
jgi:hypothetical protein